MADLQQLHDAIVNGDSKKAVAITQQAIAEKMTWELIANTMIRQWPRWGVFLSVKSISFRNCSFRPCDEGSVGSVAPFTFRFRANRWTRVIER